MSKLNFFSGPAVLPDSVMQQAADAIHNFDNTGLSILEISHRSKQFVKVMDEARALVKELMGLDANYEVLFLHGGALSQFHMVPMNLLNANETASYFDTGTWAHGALTEAKLFGNVHIACSSKDKNYTYIPREYNIATGNKYLHLTSNNTIYGTQINTPYLNQIIDTDTPIVCDMSSDIFSRQLNYNKFALIYAGAQKNAGAAGTTMVILNKDILGTAKRPIPKMLDYSRHIGADSMLNTPSVFAVYVSYLTLKWIKEQGVANLQAANQRKADKLYAAIDGSSLYKGTVEKDSRSQMNVCFLLNDETLNDKFNAYAEQHDVLGLKGHRSVGGFRASIYNAMPESGVDTLIEVMKEFERMA
ncbi:MAG: 3-phosphoserine/phosphohydroxythreonine transaminase [Bacteroidetes bacterium]|nr:3-phosphoserine/phosphohydroxythreonine transaminase [Bacteroidota bacterium]